MMASESLTAPMKNSSTSVAAQGTMPPVLLPVTQQIIQENLTVLLQKNYSNLLYNCFH
jgi:hypothetical protein